MPFNRFPLRIASALVLSLGVHTPVAADTVVLFDGDTITGRVVRYERSSVTIVDAEGQTLKAPILNIKRIDFDADKAKPTGDPEPLRHEQELSERIAAAKESLATATRPSAVVAMYVETSEVGDTLPQDYVEYRCYSSFGGYSGINRVPLRQAWTRTERVYANRDGSHRIQLDPGPPYKIVNRSVFLKPGGVVNLGRVVLEKVEAEGTASLIGRVQDSFGVPLEDVLVTAGDRATRTDRDGAYRIDGVGLEILTLKVNTPGFIEASQRIEVRDMRRREINNDFTLYRPRRVRLRYVVSGEKEDSFVGPKAQEGTLERILREPRSRLAGTRFSSSSFTRFVQDGGVEMQLAGAQLRLRNFRAPMYYQPVDRGVDFATIESVGDLDINEQHCPPLGEGDMVVIRGFRERGSSVSDYCVKVIVEELQVLRDGE